MSSLVTDLIREIKEEPMSRRVVVADHYLCTGAEQIGRVAFDLGSRLCGKYGDSGGTGRVRTPATFQHESRVDILHPGYGGAAKYGRLARLVPTETVLPT